MAEMPDMKKQDDEWQMWQHVCKQFTTLTDIDINDAKCDPLVRAIQAWGELLVDLRADQSDTQVQIARADALGNYLQVTGSG